MPIIKARSSSLSGSLDLRGTPTAPTASQSVHTTQVATTAYVGTAVTNLINSAPSVLDTLSELASAINNDASFTSTVTTALAGKLAKAGDTMSGYLILNADPVANLGATTKQYVDSLINGITINSTDDVPEGSNNLYYLSSRVRGDISLSSNNTSVLDYNSTTGAFTYSHPTSDGVLEGTTNVYFTNARARTAVSLTTDDNSILTYSSSTGGFTFAKPNTDKVAEGSTNLYFTTARARASVSNGSNIAYDSATGIISTQAAVWSVNGQNHTVVLTTSDIAEGTNLYYTDTRARAAVSLTTGNSNLLAYNATTGVFTFVVPTTTDIAEGTNLYYTDTRARAAISATGWDRLSYTAGTGVINITAPNTTNVAEDPGATVTSGTMYFTNARVKAAISAVDAGGDGSFAYDSATGAFTYTGPSPAEVRAHFSAATSGTGWGGLTYDSATGVVTYAKVTDANIRQALSAATSGTGFGGLTYDSATGVVTYAKVTAADVRGNLSATTASGATYDSATGVIALANIPNASLTNSKVTLNTYDVSLGGSLTLNADDIAEAVGGTNKYLTDARWDTRLATKTTTNLAEGSNLYYTTARFDTQLATKTTTNLAEGTNLYYTNARARAALVGGTGVSYNTSTGEIAIGQAVETSSNVTFGNVTVGGDLTVNGTMTAVNSTVVTIADKNITLGAGAANASAANGAGITVDGAGATITYVSSSDKWALNKGLTVAGDLSITGGLSAPSFTGDLNGSVSGASGTFSSLINGRVVFAGSAGLLSSDSDLTFLTDTLTATKMVGTTSVSTASLTASSLTSGRVTFAGTAGLLSDDAGLTFAAGVLTSTVGFAGALTGNVTGNLTGNVTGQVSDISNHNTSELAEDPGATVSSGTMYFTQARARGTLSVVDAGGDGSFAYNSATGAFTYTGPSPTEVRAHFSATASGTGWGDLTYAAGVFTYAKVTDANIRQALSATSASGATYSSSTGVIALAAIPNSSLTNSKVTINTHDVSLGDSLVLNTDDVQELGSPTNKYFTDTRARNAISLTTSKNTVLSYNATTGVFVFDLAHTTTDDVAEGSTNKYYTDTRARAAISNGANIDYDNTTGVVSTQAAVWSVNGQNHTVVLSSDDVSDLGRTNKWFTNAQARAAITLTTNDSNVLSYNGGTGVFTYAKPNTDAVAEGSTNLYYTNARADARIAAASVNDLADVDTTVGLSDGYTLVWSAATSKFVPQNIATSSTSLNFTGDGTTLSYSTGVLVSSIDNTQVYVNGLIQAPTYSYSISTTSGITSIVLTEAPEQDDYIFVRVSSVSGLTAGGVLNESSTIDGGTY